MINLKQSCAVIAALLTLVACAGVCAAAPAEPPQREIKVVARRFEFVPKTITAKKGERLRLVVTSEDVDHGVAIPEFGVDQIVKAKQTKVIAETAIRIWRES